MALSLEMVRDAVNVEEPQYDLLTKQFGADAVPHLAEIVKTGPPLLAAKAAYLASTIKSREAAAVVELAAQHFDLSVRVAAAGGAANLDYSAGVRILSRLLDDSAAGVQKVALDSVSAMRANDVLDQVRNLRTSKDEYIRTKAQDVLNFFESEDLK